MLIRKIRTILVLNNYYKQYATKPCVVPNDAVISKIEENVFKPKQHPGIIKSKTRTLPDAFVKAVLKTVEDYPIKSLLKDSENLAEHLKMKVPPMEKEEIKLTVEMVKSKELAKLKNVEVNTEEDEKKFDDMVRNKVQNRLKKKIYNWQAIKYDEYSSLVYLFARSAAEFSVLTKIFTELSIRDPEFKPKTLFDFGSGIGTVTWAANLFWKKYLFEYFNVDASAEMNDLAQILLQGGKGNARVPVKGVFYRQFLPATNTGYDLVVSAYSLLELPGSLSRLQTILNLWNKTQNYLIIVEQGTNAGFKVVNEVRDFILQLKESPGHVFSPCPHNDICPRFLANDGTPCNFEVKYLSLPVGANSTSKNERYSYVVLKKGNQESSDLQWPRIVREPLVRSKHVICRMCAPNGKFEEVIFTSSKHGKTMYHCARASKWGDLLPITVINKSCDETQNVSDKKT